MHIFHGRRLTYANVTATLALVFSMSGGALAANHYLIGSAKQINPKVLKSLKGKTGKTGAAGAAGTAGAPGAKGLQGIPGEVGPRGPSNGFQAFKDEVGNLATSLKTVGTLAVPAGSYLVSAKLWVDNKATEREKATCTLTNDENGDSDNSEVVLETIGATSFRGRGVIALQAATTLAAAGHFLVNCSGNLTSEIVAHDLKIQALQVGSLSNSNA